MIYTVKLHAVVLYNIGDHITRDIPLLVGVMLGTVCDGTVEVHQLFEVPEAHGKLDEAFLHKRAAQFKTVLPNYSIVGIYFIGDSVNTDIVDQFSLYDQPLVVTTFTAVNKFTLYYQGNPIKTMVVASESERIATETIARFQDYSQLALGSVPEVLLTAHLANLAQLVALIYDQMVKILAWMSADEKDVAKRVRINNKIVYLSHKLAALKRAPAPDPTTSVCAAELALLTEELAVLLKLKALVAQNVLKASVAGGTDRLSEQSRQWVDQLGSF